MTDLIARLEAASEGSRELSDECLLAVGVKLIKESGDDYSYIALGLDDDGGPWKPAPDPSRNVQDAIDWMVPEGWWWQITQAGFAVGSKGGEVFTALLFQPKKDVRGIHATSALALCIASLRAREAD